MSGRLVLCGLLAAGLMLIVLPGCGSKVSKDNYDKITNNMTLADVENVLGKGEPQGGASGAVGNLSGSVKQYKWVDGKKTITITFVNDKVTLKAADGL